MKHSGTDMTLALFSKRMQALLLKMLMMASLFQEYCSALTQTNLSVRLLTLTPDFTR